MKQKLLSVFTQIEAQKSDIISLYESLSPGQLRFNPEAGKWNLLQVLRHIVTAEQQSLKLIRHKLRDAEALPKAGLGSSVRHLLLKVALWLPIRFKAPKMVRVDEPYPDFEIMISEWEEVREELKQIIDQNSAEVLSKAMYKHPRAGYLNMQQALEFFENHIKHHRKQIMRIRADHRFPGYE